MGLTLAAPLLEPILDSGLLERDGLSLQLWRQVEQSVVLQPQLWLQCPVHFRDEGRWTVWAANLGPEAEAQSVARQQWQHSWAVAARPGALFLDSEQMMLG